MRNGIEIGTAVTTWICLRITNGKDRAIVLLPSFFCFHWLINIHFFKPLVLTDKELFVSQRLENNVTCGIKIQYLQWLGSDWFWIHSYTCIVCAYQNNNVLFFSINYLNIFYHVKNLTESTSVFCDSRNI